MHWTTNSPTKEGFYWCKCYSILKNSTYITVVKAYSSNTKTKKVDTVFWDGENFTLNKDDFREWSSEPIEMPT